MPHRKLMALAGLALTVGLGEFVAADIINVPGDFATIQAAIDAAVSGVDEIVVGPGRYSEVIDFLGKAITLRSSGGAGVTTIDGTGLNDSVVKCMSGEGAATILEGFAITGGTGSLCPGSTTLFCGGGMRNVNSSPTVTNCAFIGNTVNGLGGGMHNRPASSPTVTNCTFSGNTAAFGGGMLNRDGSNPAVTNCTFNGNSVIPGTGGGMFSQSSTPSVTNCILWGDSPQEFNSSSTPTISFSDVQGGLPAGAIDGGGNINADPLFVDPHGEDDILGTEDDNLRVSPGSACIDAGDNTAVPPDTADLDDDNDTTKPTPLDLDGNPRFVDDPNTPDTGNGTPPIVDMGAYEFDPSILVYSNTGPSFLYQPEAFRRIADDIRTIATCGCPLNSYEVRVSGGGTGAGSGYTVETGIYDDCPSFGGQLIPGTEETFVVPDDAEYTLTKTIAPAVVNIPRNIWLGVMFDANHGGWLVGTPAEIGTTLDFYDFPFFPCVATTGIPGRYSGFWARVLCDGLGGLAAPAGPSPASAETDVYPIVQLDWNGGAAARTTPGGGGGSGDTPVWDVDPHWRDDLEPGQWCGTQERYEARGLGQGDDAGRLACPQQGACDDAVTRDGFIPTADTPFTTYRVYLHVFCRDNGTACTSSAAEVVAQMVTVNADFEPWKIKFEYDFRFVNDTQQRDFWISGDEQTMKSTYAIDPDQQCNVYVAETGGSSWGTYPWDSNALNAFGGVVMAESQFSSTDDILTHEMGHNLGLWHTHRGVSQVLECGDCYEFAGAPSDDRGDFCSDTDPTPLNWICAGPGGNDPCNGTPWGLTDFRNYMGYAKSSCRNHFTEQQAGRFHCWSQTELSTWQVPPECDPLYDVYFNDFTPPTSLLCEGVSSPTCDPGPLNCATTYYWQVVANLGTTGASATGLIWSFDTPAGPDCQPNGVVDTCDIAFGGIPDCNGDGVPDDCHADTDGDTVPDPCDICLGGNDLVDTDSDGVPDFCDACPLDNPDDTDGDGVCDSNDPCPLDNPDDTDADTVCDSEDNCELANTDQADCQPNGVGDVCDIAIGGMPDGNGNGVPDVCEVSRPMPENGLGNTNCLTDAECINKAYCVPDPAGGFPGICYVPKNRYLSVAPNAGNITATARRLSVVKFARSCGGAGNTTCTSNTGCSGNPDGSTCDDVAVGSQVIGWFGQPDADGYANIVNETSRHYTIWLNPVFPIECGVDELCPAGSHCDTGLGASNTCRLDADNTEVTTNVVHLSGCHISPKRRDVRPGVAENRAPNYYLIEAIPELADITEPANYSAPLELRTVVVWGDMTGGTSGNVALPPEGSPGFLDVLQQVNGFKDQGKATTPWLDLDPQEPDRAVGFLDMLKAVGGFKDEPYPWDDPCTCAGLAPCADAWRRAPGPQDRRND